MAEVQVLDMLMTISRFILLINIVLLVGEIWLFLNVSEILKKMNELESFMASKKSSKSR